MAKLILSVVLIVAFANSVHMQLGQSSSYQQNQQIPGLSSLLNQNTNQDGLIPQLQLRPNDGNMLSNLMGGNGNLADTLRNIPARGMQFINQLLSSVRNMVPGLGRNNSAYPQNPLMNMQGQNSNGLNLPLNGLTGPINDLQQGRLPNMNSLQQGISSTVNDLGNTLTRTLSMGSGANTNPGGLNLPGLTQRN